MRKQKLEVNFTQNNELTRCDMYYDGKSFIGYAKCLPEDNDMISERTGCTLAEIKANIKRLRYIRNKVRE